MCSIVGRRQPTSHGRASRKAAATRYTLLLGSMRTRSSALCEGRLALEDSRRCRALRRQPTILSSIHHRRGERPGADRASQEQAGNASRSCRYRHQPHLSLETFRRMAGVEDYDGAVQGGGEAQQGILGGQVPFMFSTTIASCRTCAAVIACARGLQREAHRHCARTGDSRRVRPAGF